VTSSHESDPLVELSSWNNYDVRVPYQWIHEDHYRMGALSSALVWLRSLRLVLKGGGVEQLQDGMGAARLEGFVSLLEDLTWQGRSSPARRHCAKHILA